MQMLPIQLPTVARQDLKFLFIKLIVAPNLSESGDQVFVLKDVLGDEAVTISSGYRRGNRGSRRATENLRMKSDLQNC